MMIKRKCIPSKESERRQLTPGTPPSPYDLDTKTFRVSPETLALAESQEKDLGRLPESWLNLEPSALQAA
jgi:hypothetical protein